MKTIIHRSDSRGFANHGWLKSYHTFSFANYQNAERMNFGALRVLNDDLVKPKMGFGTHPHKNMEIISIPLSGALSHKDNMGNKRAIEVGEVQVMSAGTGLTHSEFNDSSTSDVNFLQLWVIPETLNVLPNYEQRKFEMANQINKIQTVVAPKNHLEADALPINQQAYIYRSDLDSENSVTLTIKNSNNGFYVFVVEGEVVIGNVILKSRDAIGVWETENLEVKAKKNSSVIIIEVPMN
jgi:redox-sensitive bicupin YhaK (pirin superfamily)